MSTLTLLHPHEPSQQATSILPSHSYYFYKELSLKTTDNSSSLLSRQPKQIIPSIPRQHFKAPKNSSLSPIRSQKIMPKQDLVDTEFIITKTSKRPYPLVTTFSSPVSIQTTRKNRQRKVSFNEKVIVVASSPSLFTEEETPTKKIRRHSTGEDSTQQPKSILIQQRLGSLQESPEEETFVFTQKITKSLKQFKNRLLFI